MVIGQGAYILCFRCGGYASISTGLETAYEECAQVWRDAGGDYGGAGVGDTTFYKYHGCWVADIGARDEKWGGMKRFARKRISG